ncbi:MAG: hypothetical protein NVS2B2_39170 [Ktedonobacteraceae bacterium]
MSNLLLLITNIIDITSLPTLPMNAARELLGVVFDELLRGW